ncbi:MAG: ComF family protein [Gemmatimonadales bacterium]
MANALQHLLLPAECLLCRALLPFARADQLVCAVCRHRWRPVRPPWCERCGQPEPLFGACRLCAAWPAALRQVRSAVWLEDGPRAAIHALKYQGLARLADDLAEVMARHLPAPDEASVLVPIPLGPRRLRERGYNQSERLAAALAQRWDRPTAACLGRVRDTPSQTALTPQARLANVAGAFATRNAEVGTRTGASADCSPFRVPRSTFVLVDDVFTTGATLAAAAQALARAGRTRVHAVTFGRATIPDFT